MAAATPIKETTVPFDKAGAMLVHDEGLRLRAYKCPAGDWTIGVGRNLSARGVTATQLLWYRTVGVTRATAFAWLKEDVAEAEADCKSLFGEVLWSSWSENRRLGWINFLFNLGLTRALGFRNTLRAVRGARWQEVRLHLEASKWFRDVKGRAPRVISMICEEKFPYDR